MDLKCQHIQAGLLRPRKKRKFSKYKAGVGPLSHAYTPSDEPSPHSITPGAGSGNESEDVKEDEPDEELTFSEVVDKLIKASIDCDAFGEEFSGFLSDNADHETAQPTHTQIPLKDLYEGDTSTGLDMFWERGVKSLDEEQAYYELKTAATATSACLM
ncbi:hypothetical protein BV22DRAFT_1131184 [Leucogyrophana mollusca]|uniref:Uncharacterized protein n=1 Tax=Leucogyrophana mollusca TaxID=85980 RepID=A0ACB8BD10_9AGAM|nr:hypothetical protein BV22DRAFT_1131184 [Leucogyrophana mollusca]